MKITGRIKNDMIQDIKSPVIYLPPCDRQGYWFYYGRTFRNRLNADMPLHVKHERTGPLELQMISVEYAYKETNNRRII